MLWKRGLMFIGLLLSGLLLVNFISAQDDATEEDAVVEVRLENYTFRPIEDIVNRPLEVTGFANGTATLPIETAIPVACSVVYGTTTEFGQLSLDQDMAGGTHAIHSPLLTDLEPDTTYYFRVQGVDDNGVVYISDVMTFTTPPAEEAVNDNLLSPENGAEIIGYSSAYGGADIDERWGVGSAFDANPGTAWSTAGDGDDAWVEVKLAQPSHISRIEFWTRFMNDGTARILSFTVTTDSGEVYGPFELLDAEQMYGFDVDFVAESLRFDVVESTGGNTGAAEIAAYGEPVSP